MKKEMELCIFVSELTDLLQMEETLSFASSPPTPDVMQILDSNVKTNQKSLVTIRDFFYIQYGKDYLTNIERIYYGNETCEFLIPDLEDVKKALKYCEEKEYDFSFVTPYVGPGGMEKLIGILDFLNQQDDIEVIVNDFGILHLINQQFPNLHPGLGRLLVKLKRDPRFSKSEYTARDKNIKNIGKVQKNQYDVLQDNSLAIPEYQAFLKEKGIERAGIDVVPQGVKYGGKISTWGFPVDVYWPWTYITSGRNCAVAAHTQLGKTYHQTDEPCYKQCKLFEFTFSSDKDMLPTLQRGNTVWMDSSQLYEDYFKTGFDRLIYQPYIPV